MTSSWYFRPISIVIIAVTLLTVQYFSTARPAHAATLEPLTTNSYYLDDRLYNMAVNINLTMTLLGEADALQENQSIHGSCYAGEYPVYVILAYGQPFNYNINNYHQVTNTWYDAEILANNYAQGWYSNSFNCFRLHFVIGVNNNVCANWQSTNNTDPCVPQEGLDFERSKYVFLNKCN